MAKFYMNPPNISQPLLLMAKKDLKAAKTLAVSADPDIEIVGFHLQQATEKSLKAWLVSLGEPLIKTHDISFLLNRLEELQQSIDDELWLLAELNPFAVQFRYGLFDDEPLDWQASYQHIEGLIQTIELFTYGAPHE